jgi:hypothetical protein
MITPSFLLVREVKPGKVYGSIEEWTGEVWDVDLENLTRRRYAKA